jgi:hypothetical protein
MSGDYGIKIVKDGESLESTDLDDYIFRSDVQSLPLIQKVEVNKTITSGDCVGTYTYTHNLGSFFFTQVFLVDKSYGIKQSLPFTDEDPSNKFYCDGDRFLEQFSYRIYEDSVEIDYDVECVIPMMGGYCSGSNITYTFEISIYMFELGV